MRSPATLALLACVLCATRAAGLDGAPEAKDQVAKEVNDADVQWGVVVADAKDDDDTDEPKDDKEPPKDVAPKEEEQSRTDCVKLSNTTVEGAIQQSPLVSPPWVTFLTTLVSMFVTLEFFGPAKPEVEKPDKATMSKLQLAKADVTGVIVPYGMLAWFFYSAGCTLMEMGRFLALGLGEAPSQWDVSMWFEFLKLFQGVGYAVGTSGILSKWASALQLRHLHKSHCKVLYAHMGAQMAEEMMAAGDPVPVEHRYGIAAGFELAGHTVDDWTKVLEQNEGYLKTFYNRAVWWTGIGFVVVGGFCSIMPALFWPPLLWSLPLLISYKVVPWCMASIVVRQFGREPKVLKVPGTDPSAPDMSRTLEKKPVQADPTTRPLKRLDDGDAIFYLMLELEEDRRLVFTCDYTAEKPWFFKKKFSKGDKVVATSALTYKALCGVTERIEVMWREGHGDNGTNYCAMVPLSAVAPQFSRDDAREMYDKELPLFKKTGLMTAGWQAYFRFPFLAWVVETMLVTGGSFLNENGTDSYLTGIPYIEKMLSSVSGGLGVAGEVLGRVF